MSSEDMWLSTDEEVQLVEEKGLETDFWSSRFWRANAGKQHLGVPAVARAWRAQRSRSQKEKAMPGNPDMYCCT